MRELAASDVVVLDGHDGTGKSTIAAAIAELRGGRVVKPFAGHLGDHIAWLWRRHEFHDADRLARSAIERAMDVNRDADLLVFDRHWASLFTVLPEALWSSWLPLPQTVILTANARVVQQRLLDRHEEIGELHAHRRYLTRYEALAQRFCGGRLVDTSSLSLRASIEAVEAFLPGTDDDVATARPPSQAVAGGVAAHCEGWA